jgi:hypothetical protein
MIGIALDRSGFNARFGQVLAQSKNPVAILKAAGRELANQLKKHFRMKEQTNPNKLSPRREHFWLDIAQSVNNPEQTGYNTISVRVSDPRIAQKVFGGVITAKKAAALTIPVAEKAYGRTAATFEAETGLKLFLLGPKDHSRGGVLAAKVGDQIEVEYVLTKSVDQKPDPTAIPDLGDLEKAVLARAQAVLTSETKKAEG